MAGGSFRNLPCFHSLEGSPSLSFTHTHTHTDTHTHGRTHAHAGHTSKEGELAAYVDTRNAIEVYGLKKKYGGSNGCCGHSLVCCTLCDGCSCHASESFWPIKVSVSSLSHCVPVCFH